MEKCINVFTKRVSLLFLSLVVCQCSWAQVEIDGLYYEFNESEQTAVVTGCSYGYLQEIVIPNNVNYNDTNYDVVSINDYAFSYSNIQSVDIPASIQYIGTESFIYCSNLTSVTTHSQCDIMNGAFTGINAEAILYYSQDIDLTGWENYFMDTVRFYDNMCGENVRWELNGSILRIIGYGKMYDYIEQEAPWLEYKESIEILIMDDDITHIGGAAFNNCSNLMHVWIPYNLMSIGEMAFRGCGQMRFIDMGYYIDGGDNPLSPYLAHNTSYGIIEKTTNTLVVGCGDGVVPEGIEHIGDYAFLRYGNLNSVVVPYGVKSIGNGVFLGSSITSLHLPETITKIAQAFSMGGDLLEGWENFKSVHITNLYSWFNIDYSNYGTPLAAAHSLYLNGNKLTEIIVPDGITEIKSAALAGWDGTSITIPESVTSIGFRAFSGCFSLKTIKMLSKNPPILNPYFSYYGISGGVEVTNEINLSEIIVPYGCAEAYKTAEVWKDFADIIVEAAPPSTTTLTIGSTGSTTFSSLYNLDFSNVAGIKAYTATGYNSDNGELTLVRIKEAKAGTGLYVSGNAGTYTIPTISSTAYNSLNMFVGVNEETTISTTDGSYTNYIYTKPSGKEAGFYKVTTDRAIPAGKAYLQIPTAWLNEETTSEAKAVKLVFDDGESTGIDEVNRVESKEDVIYDLQGRRVKNPSKGIYIINGRKVVR